MVHNPCITATGVTESVNLGLLTCRMSWSKQRVFWLVQWSSGQLNITEILWWRCWYHNKLATVIAHMTGDVSRCLCLRILQKYSGGDVGVTRRWLQLLHIYAILHIWPVTRCVLIIIYMPQIAYKWRSVFLQIAMSSNDSSSCYWLNTHFVFIVPATTGLLLPMYFNQ